LKDSQFRPAKSQAEATKEISYEVPKGGASELVAFIKALKAHKPKGRDEYFGHFQKSHVAVKAAAERIVELDPDPSHEAHRFARRHLLHAAIAELKTVDQLGQIEQDVRDYLAKEEEFGFAPESLEPARSLAESMEYRGDREKAAAFHEYYVELAKKHGAEENLDRFVAIARRLRLPGNALKIEGDTVDGKPLDWESYRGRVVLVDFWATWCGPCCRELREIRKLYDKFHDKGFEVIGVSHDDDRAAVEAFLEKEKLPWVNLFRDGERRPPVVEYYGIHGIPHCILVDRDGKVIKEGLNSRWVAELVAEKCGAPR